MNRGMKVNTRNAGGQGNELKRSVLHTQPFMSSTVRSARSMCSLSFLTPIHKVRTSPGNQRLWTTSIRERVGSRISGSQRLIPGAQVLSLLSHPYGLGLLSLDSYG